MGKELGMVCMLVILATTGSLKSRRITVQANLGKKYHPVFKVMRAKMAGGMGQVVKAQVGCPKFRSQYCRGKI
jgi:hypothetical protein